MEPGVTTIEEVVSPVLQEYTPPVVVLSVTLPPGQMVEGGETFAEAILFIVMVVVAVLEQLALDTVTV